MRKLSTSDSEDTPKVEISIYYSKSSLVLTKNDHNLIKVITVQEGFLYTPLTYLVITKSIAPGRRKKKAPTPPTKSSTPSINPLATPSSAIEATGAKPKIRKRLGLERLTRFVTIMFVVQCNQEEIQPGQITWPW